MTFVLGMLAGATAMFGLFVLIFETRKREP